MIYSSPFYDNSNFLATVIQITDDSTPFIFHHLFNYKQKNERKNTEATFAPVF